MKQVANIKLLIITPLISMVLSPMTLNVIALTPTVTAPSLAPYPTTPKVTEPMKLHILPSPLVGSLPALSQTVEVLLPRSSAKVTWVKTVIRVISTVLIVETAQVTGMVPKETPLMTTTPKATTNPSALMLYSSLMSSLNSLPQFTLPTLLNSS